MLWIYIFPIFMMASPQGGESMVNTVQLDMFKRSSEFSELYEELEALKNSHDNVRRGFFAKLSALTLLIVRLEEEQNKIKEMLETRQKAEVIEIGET